METGKRKKEQEFKSSKFTRMVYVVLKILGKAKMDIAECRRLSSLAKQEWSKIGAFYEPVEQAKIYNFEARLRNLIDVKKVFDEKKIPFWLNGGALLGAYRDNDWIPYDNDIDLAILEEDWKSQVKELHNIFINLGFIVRSSIYSKFSRLTLFREKEQIGLFGWYLDPSYEGGKYRVRPTSRIPTKFFENKEYIEFKGVSFCVLNPIEEYLIWQYGKKWQIPLDYHETIEWTSGNKYRDRKHWKKWMESFIKNEQ